MFRLTQVAFVHILLITVFSLSAIEASSSSYQDPGRSLRSWNLEEVLRQGMKTGREMRRIKARYLSDTATYKQSRANYTTSMVLSTTDEGDHSSSISQILKNSGSLSASFSEDGDATADKSRSVTWIHPIFRQNDLQLNRANLNWEIAALQRDDSVVGYRFSIIENFYEVLRLQERVKVNKNAVERWKKLLEFAQARYELGTSTKIDILNAQVNLGQAENDVLQEEQTLFTTRDRLTDLIGLPPEIHIQSAEPLKFETADLTVDDEWVIEGLEVSRTRLKIARLETRDGRRDSRPDLELSSSYSNNDGDDSEFTGSLRWSLALGRRPEEHRYEGLKQREIISRIDLEEAEADSRINQQTALNNIHRLERSVHIAQESVRQAEESMEFSQFSFEKGLVSAIELREAQANVTTARSSLVNLKINYRLAVFRYLRAMGGNLD